MANTTNERLFAKANMVAIRNGKENEALRSIYFLEGTDVWASFMVEYANKKTGEYREEKIRVDVSKCLTFKESLELAKMAGISPTDLKIADEVEAFFETMPSPSEEDFTIICSLVCETYYNTDVEFDINECTKVIISLFENGYTFNEISAMPSWERIETYEELC